MRNRRRKRLQHFLWQFVKTSFNCWIMRNDNQAHHVRRSKPRIFWIMLLGKKCCCIQTSSSSGVWFNLNVFKLLRISRWILNIHRKLVDWEWMTIMIIQVPQSRHMSAGGIMTSWTWSRLKQTHFHVFLRFLHHNSYLYEHGWPCLDLYLYYDEFSTGFQAMETGSRLI